jgi:anti-sigma regulatory factor (Ser/Thr protein kinase)
MESNSDLTKTPESVDEPEPILHLGENAPRGARVVLSRILKDGAKVPLFLGQTLVNSLRDLGYNDTTSAVCELVDNSIQWGASEVRVYFHQSGRRDDHQTNVLVVDNGKGMAPHVLKVATAFGGSMIYNERSGIGRYGVGMKGAALSMSPVMELFSWQEPDAIYNMTLDVNDIGSNRSNLIELPDPNLTDGLPSEIVRILTVPMIYPKNPNETQELFARNVQEVRERLGNSGTIVFMPDCDRLTHTRVQTMVDQAIKEMARVYRRQLEKGLKLYVNNRRVEPFDPTYWMSSARHTRIEGIRETQSRLVNSWQVNIPAQENRETAYPVSIRLYALPIEEWSQLSRKVLKNDLRVYDDHTVSFMRNDREVYIGTVPKLVGKRHADLTWTRLQIDFPGELDEAFGIAVNKQGVRPKDYALELIRQRVQDDVAHLRDLAKQFRSEQAARQSGSKLGEAERKANETDAFQGKPLPQSAPQNDEERKALEENLRALAIGLKREDETDDAAHERIKNSRYITVFKHDNYWPFYHAEYKYGKVILTINTAHAFFTKLYEPLSRLSQSGIVADSEEENVDPKTVADCSAALVALQLLLLSLARTQSQMTGTDSDEELCKFFETFRREWSSNLDTQLRSL